MGTVVRPTWIRALVRALGFALVSLTPCEPAAAGCKLVKLAELPVTMRGRPSVPVSINGHTTSMIVDTGSWKTMIWRPAAASLDLKLTSAHMTNYGAGGEDSVDRVRVRDFTLAGYTVHDFDMYAAGRGQAGEAAGFIGEDLLSRIDVEFDLQAGAIRLFTPEGCQGDQVVYWAASYSMVPLLRPPGNTNWPVANVSVNGHEALALFDSGASNSTITTSAIKRPGMSPENTPTSAGSGRGIAGKAFATDIATFETVTVGQESVQHAQLMIADLSNRTIRTGSLIPQDVVGNPDLLEREPDLILGADFFLAHRIYIARSQKKLYFTYRGGPLFQPRVPQQVTKP